MTSIFSWKWSKYHSHNKDTKNNSKSGTVLLLSREIWTKTRQPSLPPLTKQLKPAVFENRPIMHCKLSIIINNNNQCYLVRVTLNSKADKPVALISGSNWNLECWFLWREENRRTRRKTLGARTRTNNKLNHMWRRVRESNPGDSGGRRALTTAPSLLPNIGQYTYWINIRHVCQWIVSLLMPYWFQLQNNNSFDNKYFRNWSDNAADIMFTIEQR